MAHKRCKVIISDLEPEIVLAILDPEAPPVQSGVVGVDIGFLWFQPSTQTFYKVIATDPISWEPMEYSGYLGNVDFVGTISVDGDIGITGSRTVGGFKITFKNGILTGFEPV